MVRQGDAQGAAGKPGIEGLGRRIRELRKSRGWSIRELAERAGISHTHVGQIESGAVPEPSIGKVARIADALAVSVSALVVGDTPTAAPVLELIQADLNMLEALDPDSLLVVSALTTALRVRAERQTSKRPRRPAPRKSKNSN